MYSNDCEPINNLFKSNSMAIPWNGNNCCDIQWGPTKKSKKRDYIPDEDLRIANNSMNREMEEKDLKNDKHNELIKRVDEIVNKVECQVIRNEAKVVSIKLQADDDFKIKSDDFPMQFGQLSELKYLWLSNHKIKKLTPSIGNMKKLEQLVLINNDISGEIPTEIGRLTNLIGLNMSGNKLKGPIPASIANMTRLNTLQLYNNDLEGPLPDLLLTLPIKTCTISENKGLCLSDKAKFWDSECKNSVSELCSEMKNGGGLGKVGVIVLILVLLFIATLVVYCFIHYRNTGSLDDIKFNFMNRKLFFNNNNNNNNPSNAYSSKYDYSKYEPYRKQSNHFSFYPSTKYFHSPKKTNYADDTPVELQGPKYLPSTVPYGFDYDNKNNNLNNKHHNYINYDYEDRHKYQNPYNQPYNYNEPLEDHDNEYPYDDYINPNFDGQNNPPYDNYHGYFDGDEPSFNNKMNGGPDHKFHNPFLHKDRKNHYSLNTVESDKAQWTDSDIDHYIYGPTKDYLDKSLSMKNKIVVPIRTIFHSKSHENDTIDNPGFLDKNNNNINNSNNDKNRRKKSSNIHKHTNSNNSNTTLVNNKSSSKKLSKKHYDKELPIPKDSKKKSQSHHHHSSKKHSRHPSLNYDEEIIFVNDNFGNINHNISQSTLKPLPPKKSNNSLKNYQNDNNNNILNNDFNNNNNMNDDDHPNKNNYYNNNNKNNNNNNYPNNNIPKMNNSMYKAKRRSKKINFFPDIEPDYDVDSDDSLESLSSGLPPPVRTSLQSLSNGSSYELINENQNNRMDSRSNVYRYDKYGNIIMDNNQNYPPSYPEQNNSRKKNEMLNTSFYNPNNNNNNINNNNNNNNKNDNGNFYGENPGLDEPNNFMGNNRMNNNSNDNILKNHSSSSETIYYVVRPYKAQRTDEISIHPGDAVNIYKSFDDGWAEGLNKTTNKIGMFPLNFVQLSGSSYDSDRLSKNNNHGNYNGNGLDRKDQMDNTRILLFRQKIAEADTLRKLLSDPSLSDDRRRKCYSRLQKIESAFN